MKNKALGMIETYGYLPSIEAADAALKAANVKLLKLEQATGGLNTIYLMGDVSAVKSSVDAGAAAASRVGQVISTTVIPRMADQLENMVTFLGDSGKIQVGLEEEVQVVDQDLEEKNGSIEDQYEFKGNTIDIRDESILGEMKVSELRQLIRSIDEIQLTNDEIKFGRKKDLIETLVEYGREGVVR